MPVAACSLREGRHVDRARSEGGFPRLMPLVSFKPTKARLVIEDGKDSVLVMKVAVAKGETVELAGGGRLEALSGVLRIRERKASSRGNGAIGSLVFIDESGRGTNYAPAKFQINLGMAAEKFEPLLRVALSGRLPNKFFVDAGERVSAHETRGLSYGLRRDGRTKIWDTTTFRSLPVTNFAMILPIEVPEPRENGNGAPAAAPVEHIPMESMATNAQVAELVDDLLVFQSETRNTLYAMVAIVGVVVVLTLVFGLVLLFR
jgi:hypothetical protein